MSLLLLSSRRLPGLSFPDSLGDLPDGLVNMLICCESRHLLVRVSDILGKQPVSICPFLHSVKRTILQLCEPVMPFAFALRGKIELLFGPTAGGMTRQDHGPANQMAK